LLSKIIKGRGNFTFENNYDEMNKNLEKLRLQENQKSVPQITSSFEKNGYLSSERVYKNAKVKIFT
jgi:hypothetical protein